MVKREEKKIGFFKSLILENPVFVLCLGMCPTLALTTTFECAYMMGLSVLFVLFFSNMIVSLLSRFIDDQIRIPAYIMIIATFVTILELFLGKYLPDLNEALGIYLPLIVVNCIILGRALSYASAHNVLQSIIDAFKIGLGFTLALSILGIIREVLGSNTITIFENISSFTGYVLKFQVFSVNDIIPSSLFISPSGAFITLGIIIGIINTILDRGEVK